MNDVIIETLAEKVKAHEDKINKQNEVTQQMNATISTLKMESERTQNIAAIVKELESNIEKIKWPVADIERLNSILARNNHLLENPKRQKVVHVHTDSKMLWAVTGVSLLSIFLIFGWINTFQSLSQYQMNDICWRYLKMDSITKQIPSLHQIEWQYRRDPDAMIKQVEQQELLIREEADLQLQLRKLQKEKSKSFSRQ